VTVDELRKTTLLFLESNHMAHMGTGIYKYSAAVTSPTLYASCYAAMTKSLWNDTQTLRSEDKTQWAAYINSFQGEDGLFLDPVIYNQGWYQGDPLDCGRPHLTCHAIVALTALGAAASKPFSFLGAYAEPNRLLRWLRERDWGERVAWTGNEIMNIGMLLQYTRDFHGDEKAGRAIKLMLEWLSENHVHPETGMWGSLDLSLPMNRSHAVMAAYHWWPLFFYDKYPIPYMEKAIDTVLATQNPNDGFGCGGHNPEEPYKSSACEDIDSIDPLARFSRITAYRSADIRAALEKSADWVLKNRMPDGGFVFMLDRAFEYGHPQLLGEKNQGAMFPTWFRTLSLAILGKALPDNMIGQYPWNFVRCPGYQFW